MPDAPPTPPEPDRLPEPVSTSPEPDPDEQPPPEPADEPPPEPEPIRQEAYQPLKVCSCSADMDGNGKRETVRLAAKASSVGTWITAAGTSREYAFDFIVRSKGLDPLRLPVDKTTAPPSRRRGNLLELGVGCDDDGMVYAAGSKVSRWSFADKKWSWHAELPASYVPKTAKSPAANLVINCSRLPIKKGQVHVRLAGGTIKLDLSDGQEPAGK